jgi:hypothetical protein
VPAAGGRVDLRQVFDEIEKIRKRAKKVPGVTAKSLIEEGQMRSFVFDASIALSWFVDDPVRSKR